MFYEQHANNPNRKDYCEPQGATPQSLEQSAATPLETEERGLYRRQ